MRADTERMSCVLRPMRLPALPNLRTGTGGGGMLLGALWRRLPSGAHGVLHEDTPGHSGTKKELLEEYMSVSVLVKDHKRPPAFQCVLNTRPHSH